MFDLAEDSDLRLLSEDEERASLPCPPRFWTPCRPGLLRHVLLARRPMAARGALMCPRDLNLPMSEGVVAVPV